MGLNAWRGIISVVTASVFLMPVPASAEWKYKISNNKLLNQKNYYAWVNSTNRFPYPNSNGTLARISLDQYEGKDVTVSMSIDDGNFSCNHCQITVRFDNEKPQVAWAYLYEYGSTNTLYFRGTRDACLNLSENDAILNFISKLKTSKYVSIKATVSNEGDKVFEFQTSGLKWPFNENLQPSNISRHSNNNQMCQND